MDRQGQRDTPRRPKSDGAWSCANHSQVCDERWTEPPAVPNMTEARARNTLADRAHYVFGRKTRGVAGQVLRGNRPRIDWIFGVGVILRAFRVDAQTPGARSSVIGTRAVSRTERELHPGCEYDALSMQGRPFGSQNRRNYLGSCRIGPGRAPRGSNPNTRRRPDRVVPCAFHAESTALGGVDAYDWYVLSESTLTSSAARNRHASVNRHWPRSERIGASRLKPQIVQ
jgi:hypothetical protein